MTKSDLIDIVKSFLYRVRIAESNRVLYEQYCEYAQEYNQGIMITPTFWHVVIRALVHNMMMELSKIFDNQKDSMGIEKLIAICRKNYSLFRDFDFLLDIEADLDKYKCIIENLRKQRNKIWAHNDCEYYLNPIDLEEIYKLSGSDIKVLIKLAEKVGNNILIELGEIAESKTYAGIDDILILLETMQYRAVNRRKCYHDKQ